MNTKVLNLRLHKFVNGKIHCNYSPFQNIKMDKERNDLISAIMTDSLDEFELAISENQSDPLLPLKYLSIGYTPLQFCAQRNAVRILKYLVSNYYTNGDFQKRHPAA